MELSGEEKKLQALFSDLKTIDQQASPRFAAVWQRAQIKPRRTRTLNPAFVMVAAFVVCAVGSVAVWSRYPQQTPVAGVAAPPAAQGIRNPTAAIGLAPPSTPLIETNPRGKRPVVRRTTAQLAANRKLTREAKAITDWQSPTAELLSSTSDELFSSLPQLNENASGLNSFLPSRPN